MSKKYIFLILIAFVSVSGKGVLRIPIFEDVAPYRNENFDQCNMKLNGEELVVRTFIHDNDIVFDVGANVGGWSQCVGIHASNCTIYAFEPIANCFEKLKETVQSDTMHCFNCAISNAIGSMPFFYYSYNEECSGFTERHILGEVSETFLVSTITLDSFCHEREIFHINFLKIDTEGAELKVLQGARQLLHEKRIEKIQFEYGGTYPDAGITFKEVFTILHSEGYFIFREHPQGLIRVEQWDPDKENGRYTNYFALSDLTFLEA